MPSASPPPYEQYDDYKPAHSLEPTPPPQPAPTISSVPLQPLYHNRESPAPQFFSDTRRYYVQPGSSSGSGSGSSVNQIDNLRNALSNLESRMALLLSERDLLESRLETAVRLQSPVRRLPSELLASIFVMGVMNMEEDDSLMLSTLMLVCRHWLEVAVNTPVLWTRIVAGVHHPLSHAQRKLERSKAFPLQICVDFSPRMENGTVTTESIVHTMDLLRTSIWRWKTFRLTVPNRPQAHAALMRCTDPAPLLEVFSVRVLHSMPEEQYHSNPPRPVFEGETPSLVSCSLTSFNFGWDMRLVSRLRVLKLGGYWNGYSPSIDVTLGILRACPNLEELALRNMSDVEAGACTIESDLAEYDETNERVVRVSDSRVINMPRLVKASFYYSGTLRTRTILRLLSCPVLEHVDLCFLDNVSPMLEYLRRQSLTRLPLRHLRIEGCFLSELKFSRFLQRVPSLVSLELVDVEDISSNLFKHLSAPPSAQTWICPKLTSLSLEGCTTVEWESLRSFVESRLPAHSRAFPGTQTIPTSVASSRPLGPISSASSSASASAAAQAAAISSASSSARSSAASNRPVPISKVVSSASAFAANAHILSHVPVTPQQKSGTNWPHRLHSIDLTRCHQISKEMVQWLRMYVADVKCDTAKGVWDDSAMI
ncbi:hypothetical protein BC835DRAFT_1305042 [Cytidiella melzeri]|nr:hypothetical protein BC835DRAFT_1305042 [Cytidiella melzeri]